MKIENQIVSLELAKKLKELSFKQESLFWWIKPKNIDGYGLGYTVMMLSLSKDNYDELYSAFSASELMDLFPKYISIKENEPFNNFIFRLDIRNIFIEGNFTKTYAINYYCDSTEVAGMDAWLPRTLFDHPIYDESLSNALAKTLIYLKEKQLITSFEILNGSINIIE